MYPEALHVHGPLLYVANKPVNPMWDERQQCRDRRTTYQLRSLIKLILITGSRIPGTAVEARPCSAHGCESDGHARWKVSSGWWLQPSDNRCRASGEDLEYCKINNRQNCCCCTQYMNSRYSKLNYCVYNKLYSDRGTEGGSVCFVCR